MNWNFGVSKGSSISVGWDRKAGPAIDTIISCRIAVAFETAMSSGTRDAIAYKKNTVQMRFVTFYDNNIVYLLTPSP